MQLKINLLDIETSPNVVYTWGKYEQNAIKRIKPWEVLSFAWKELDKGRVQCIARPDFSDRTDRALVREVYKIMGSSDVVIAHNGDRFDVTKMRAKFVQHGLEPTKPFKTIDTKKIAKSQFGFYSNSLNDIADELGLGRKIETGGFELWEGCMSGDSKSWRKMIRYNKHDVVLLERVFMKLRAWYPTHPNLALIDIGGTNTDCPVCTSESVQRRGYSVARVRRQARFHCQDCGHWFSRSAA
jgi:hypothetical protein